VVKNDGYHGDRSKTVEFRARIQSLEFEEGFDVLSISLLACAHLVNLPWRVYHIYGDLAGIDGSRGRSKDVEPSSDTDIIHAHGQLQYGELGRSWCLACFRTNDKNTVGAPCAAYGP
jgi:hypothetical protein